MELREINAFLQVAQFKSFSKAARHLGYSQAAITIQIKQLEQELDVHLFDRIGKQISLTRDGELFFKHANTIMQELAQARETLSRDRKLHGTLRIGTIESICTVLLPPGHEAVSYPLSGSQCPNHPRLPGNLIKQPHQRYT